MKILKFKFLKTIFSSLMLISTLSPSNVFGMQTNENAELTRELQNFNADLQARTALPSPRISADLSSVCIPETLVGVAIDRATEAPTTAMAFAVAAWRSSG